LSVLPSQPIRRGSCAAWPRTISLRAAAALAATLLSPIYLLAQPASSGCTVNHYKVVTLPLLPAAINDAGQVAGTTASHRAALWTSKGGLHELPLPLGYAHSEAVAVNTRGHILAMAFGPNFSSQMPFVYADGKSTPLPGDKARAYGINDSDVVAGEALTAGKTNTEPVLWMNHSMRLLGVCCGGSAKSINNHGEAVGDAYDEQGRYYAFSWIEASGVRRIGPPNQYSVAEAAGDGGHVVIQVLSRAFLYADGHSTRLDLAPKFPSHPHAINGCDLIVGSFGPFSDADHAFVWAKSTGFRDLNTLISPDSGWKLETAAGINQRGEIVGKGDPPGAQDSGYLLIPD
jgi:uncharacterized membrane protein